MQAEEKANGDPKPARPIKVRFPVIGGHRIAAIIRQAISEGNSMADIKLEILGVIPRGGASVQLPGGTGIDLNTDPICLIAWEDRTEASGKDVEMLAKAIVRTVLDMPVKELRDRYGQESVINLDESVQNEPGDRTPYREDSSESRFRDRAARFRAPHRVVRDLQSGPPGAANLDESVKNPEGECPPAE